MKAEIIYEDNHLILAYKKAGLLAQADSAMDIDILSILKKYIKDKYQKPGNVYLALLHRLDRPVSGLMIFAKTDKAASRMSEIIRKHQMHKYYLAVVHNNIAETFDYNLSDIAKACESFRWLHLENYLIKNTDNNTSRALTNEELNNKNLLSKAKKSRLSFIPLAYNKQHNLSLVFISLESGRHHQIRVQFSNINHSLYADCKYGKKENIYLNNNLHSYNIALSACFLSFTHPVTKKNMNFLHIHEDLKKNLGFALFPEIFTEDFHEKIKLISTIFRNGIKG